VKTSTTRDGQKSKIETGPRLEGGHGQIGDIQWVNLDLGDRQRRHKGDREGGDSPPGLITVEV